MSAIVPISASAQSQSTMEVSDQGALDFEKELKKRAAGLITHKVTCYEIADLVYLLTQLYHSNPQPLRYLHTYRDLTGELLKTTPEELLFDKNLWLLSIADTHRIITMIAKALSQTTQEGESNFDPKQIKAEIQTLCTKPLINAKQAVREVLTTHSRFPEALMSIVEGYTPEPSFVDYISEAIRTDFRVLSAASQSSIINQLGVIIKSELDGDEPALGCHMKAEDGTMEKSKIHLISTDLKASTIWDRLIEPSRHRKFLLERIAKMRATEVNQFVLRLLITCYQKGMTPEEEKIFHSRAIADHLWKAANS